MSRILVIGVGNMLRGDDGAGRQVARLLTASNLPNVAVHESSGESASLMELWEGADLVLLVDAAEAASHPGKVTRFDVSETPLPTAFFHCSTHAFGVAEAVEIARALNLLPPSAIVYGIEGLSFEHGENLTPEAQAGIREAAKMICEELKNLNHNEQAEPAAPPCTNCP